MSESNKPCEPCKPWWKRPLCFGSVLFFVGFITFGLFNIGVRATNTAEFCVSCHSMQGNLKELKETAHYKNPSGVQAGCPDCHVPREYGPMLVAKIMAAKDVWHEILGTIDTKEKFETHRWDMASRVWAKMKATDSRECRECHKAGNMDLENQGSSARKKHAKMVEKGKTCIDCHKGVAHQEPDAPPGTVLPGDEQEEEKTDSAADKPA